MRNEEAEGGLGELCDVRRFRSEVKIRSKSKPDRGDVRSYVSVECRFVVVDGQAFCTV